MARLPRVPIRQMRRLSEWIAAGTDIQHSIAGMDIELHALILIRPRVERLCLSTLQSRNVEAFFGLDTDRERLTKHLRSDRVRGSCVLEVDFQETPQPSVSHISGSVKQSLADEAVVTTL